MNNYVYMCFQVSGHPRNGIHQEGSYLVIEKQDGNNGWRVVATDANWETK